MLHDCPSLDQWHKGVPRSGRSATLLGFGILVVCGLGFGAWASTAPLYGAVVSSGTFVATGQNKQIQHLEGGIVREVTVREGDLVEPGQTLVRLDPTASVAKLRRLVLRKFRLVTTQARLEAEINGQATIAFPDSIKADVNDPELQAILKRQQIELTARIAKKNAEEEVLRKEISALGEGIIGYQSQIKSTEDRLKLFGEELKDKHALLAKQLIPRSSVYAVQRAEAGLSGQLGELLGKVSDSRERVARAEQQIVSLQSTSAQKAIEELREAESELDDISEQIRAATDVVDRIDVKAPVRGIVVKLNSHTQGGVVASGAILVELLPVNDALVIEARINPNDVVHVTEGQSALVRIAALNQRLTPMLEGTVTYLSADTIAEQNKGDAATADPNQRNSFLVRVKLDEKDVLSKVPDFKATPGMPADLFIQTAERTFLDYIMRPITDSFSRAFREH
jgi:HlyD family type I secretion membrane fusion protein